MHRRPRPHSSPRRQSFSCPPGHKRVGSSPLRSAEACPPPLAWRHPVNSRRPSTPAPHAIARPLAPLPCGPCSWAIRHPLAFLSRRPQPYQRSLSHRSSLCLWPVCEAPETPAISGTVVASRRLSDHLFMRTPRFTRRSRAQQPVHGRTPIGARITSQPWPLRVLRCAWQSGTPTHA
jgi:hypothetical protein